MDDAGALTLSNLNEFLALGTHLCSSLQWSLAIGAVAGNQSVAAWTLIGARCEFKTTEGTVKEQWCVAMRTYFGVFIDFLATGCTKSSATLIAEAIFQEEGCLAIWAFSAESWR